MDFKTLLTHTKAPCTLSQFGEPHILYVHSYVLAIHVLIKVSLTNTIHHSINQRRFTFKLCSYTYLINTAGFILVHCMSTSIDLDMKLE